MRSLAVTDRPDIQSERPLGKAVQGARWRSLLFVPGDNPSLLEKAPRSSADALIFDLEDAVSDNHKAQARSNLAGFAAGLGKAGPELLVRVNNAPSRLALDVASIPAETRAIVLPKAETADDLIALHRLVSEREAVLGLRRGAIGTVALIESPAALFELAAIGRGPRAIGLALGSEDFSVAMGAPPSPTLLTMPAQMICLAAAACRIMAFAVPCSIAAFRDVEGWTDAVKAAAAMGATGGFCIHPSQVSALNEVFSPTATEIAWAEGVMAAWAKAQASGQGVASLDGAMVDKPVVERARTFLSRRRPGSV
jgi:citrate lyase subunit beta/citryl-CoA lyase